MNKNMEKMNMDKMNAFVKANVMSAGRAYTENGAISYGTIGTALLDQFGKAGMARGRSYDEVWAEQARLWAEDAESALRFPFYLRMITRKDNIIGQGQTETVQRGQGARDEAFKRLLWVATYHKDEFYRNLWLLPVIGSWKDLWTIMSMAKNDKLPVSGVELDTQAFFTVMAEGINDQNHKDLVKKYMPRIRSEKKCTTPWAKTTNRLAKEFAEFAGWTYAEYREFKSTGRAHEFQKLICSGMYSEINWNAIPGKALLNLVSGKFLGNHSLQMDYIKWLEQQPVVKFNGYAYELMQKLGGYSYGCYGRTASLETEITVNKQFDGLIATASQNGGAIQGNVLCALDTSGSMSSGIKGTNLSAYDVCVSLGVYFSALNQGAFKDVVAMFDDTSELMTLKGTFSEKIKQIRNARTAWGGTNFQSLIDLIIKTRREHPEIPLSEFPQTLVVVSDMQFNPSGCYGMREMTNLEASTAKLRRYFPAEFVDNFKFVWWYCTNRTTADYPTTMDQGGSYMFSGFDPAVVSFLLGGEEITNEAGEKVQPSMEEIVQKALSQEALMLVH